jgi:hypothetical protein
LFRGLFFANGPVLRWCALFAAWFGAAASADAAIEVVGQNHATFAWNSAAGAVAGYYVYVSFNGAPANLHSTVTGANRQTVQARFGDVIQVSTTAFDGAGNIGPRSDSSEEVFFVDAPAPEPVPTATPLPTPTPTPIPVPSPTPISGDPVAEESPTSGDGLEDGFRGGGRVRRPYRRRTVAYDFDGDRHSDILFRNAATGELECWQMYGSEVHAVIALPSMASGWRVAGAADFDSDGTTDVVWYDDESRAVRLWLMDDFAAAREFDVQLEVGWTVAGTGDFDGDGRGEIAIWNQSNQIEIWGLRRELIRLGGFAIRHHREIAGFGDIDGDGDDDIIVQDQRKRYTEASLMSVGFSAQRVLLDKQRTALWDVIGGGDYDGDGRSDLLWRDLSADGQGGAGVWYLSSDLNLSGRPLDLNLGIDHSVLGSADYDGDGAADLLVFDPATRELVLWLMASAGAHGTVSLGTLEANWLPAGFDTQDTAGR